MYEEQPANEDHIYRFEMPQNQPVNPAVNHTGRRTNPLSFCYIINNDVTRLLSGFNYHKVTYSQRLLELL